MERKKSIERAKARICQMCFWFSHLVWNTCFVELACVPLGSIYLIKAMKNGCTASREKFETIAADNENTKTKIYRTNTTNFLLFFFFFSRCCCCNYFTCLFLWIRASTWEQLRKKSTQTNERIFQNQPRSVRSTVVFRVCFITI